MIPKSIQNKIQDKVDSMNISG